MEKRRIDQEAMAADREARYRERLEKINSDAAMHPVLKQMLLDRTLWGTQRIKTETGISEQRISLMRSRARTKPDHPLSFPPTDAILLIHNRLKDPASEAGAVLLWALQTHRLVWNSRTLKLSKPPTSRHGRRRTKKS